MTILIVATFTLSILYIAIAFVATMRDRLMLRFDNHGCQIPDRDVAVTDYGDIAEPVTEQVIQDGNVIGYVTKNIRELRQYIRENNLQDRVRVKLGKNVSKCSKGELLTAIA